MVPSYSNNLIATIVTMSAEWVQKKGVKILRLFHLFIWLSHAAFLYVDDYFWVQRKDVIHLTCTPLCQCLEIPINYKKCALSHAVHGIGWTFRISAGYFRAWRKKIKIDEIYQILDES